MTFSNLLYTFIVYLRTTQRTNNNKLTTQEIKVGLIVKTTTGITYEVTRISGVSVWFKDISRSPIWRVAKTTFINTFEKA